MLTLTTTFSAQKWPVRELQAALAVEQQLPLGEAGTRAASATLREEMHAPLKNQLRLTA